MTQKTIGFIGAGKMCNAMLESFFRASMITPEQVIVSDKNRENLLLIKKKFGIDAVTDNKEVASRAKILFLSVKPQDMPHLLNEISSEVHKNQLVVSIAAGVPLEKISSKLDAKVAGEARFSPIISKKVARVMPNTPFMVGEGMAAVAFSKNFTAHEKKRVKRLLEAAGKCIELDEKHFDAVTAVSGSGPAFYAVMVEAMIDAGIKQGLDRKHAELLALQTMHGTARLMLEKNISPQELVGMVASKGGTTEAGLKHLLSSSFKADVQKTIAAAAKRSKELSK